MIARALKQGFDIDSSFAGCDLHGNHAKCLSGEFPHFSLPNARHDLLSYSLALNRLVEDAIPSVICIDCNPLPWVVGLCLPDGIKSAYVTNFYLTGGSHFTTSQDLEWTNTYRYLELRNALRLPRINTARALYDADLVLLADLPAIIPKAFPVPPHYRICGPCYWEPAVDMPAEISSLDATLFISSGSTGKRPLPAAMVQRICETLKITQVISVGPNTYPVNSITRSFELLPGTRMARQAALTLTQGGAGSTYQALAAGCPVACWPNHRNHEILARYVEQSGLGIAFATDDWKPALIRLRQHFEAISANAKRLDHSIPLSGPQTAARHISELASLET